MAVYNPAVVVHYETEAPLAPRSTLGPYREADYLSLPDEPRCELLYGRLEVTPSPSARHQEVVLRLGRLLLEFAERAGARAFVAPLDVTLAPHSVVQPDLLLVTRERASIVGTHVVGAPDLVVEVLSPATGRRDLGEKLRLYAESGVREYWIVDLSTRVFEFLVNREGTFAVCLPEGGRYRSAVVEGLEIDLEEFWRRIPD
jgi:Uma2 family endonuclease